MALSAGRLDHRLKLQSRTTDLDATGAPASTGWQDETTVWAQRVDERADEQFEDVGEVGSLMTTWTIRHRTDVTAEWRAVDAGTTSNVFDIVGVRDPNGKKVRLELDTVKL